MGNVQASAEPLFPPLGPYQSAQSTSSHQPQLSYSVDEGTGAETLGLSFPVYGDDTIFPDGPGPDPTSEPTAESHKQVISDDH